MAAIQEIPLDTKDTQEHIQNNDEVNEETNNIPHQGEDIPKKGRGRPAGAKNKPKPPAPSKPKAKPKAKHKKIEEEYEEYTESEEEAPPPRRRAQSSIQAPLQGAELDRHALAADVLGILQQQRYQKTSARRNHYASWFANLS